MKLVRNLKIRTKLIAAFVLMFVFALIVGVMGIVGMDRIQQADTAMYETNTVPLGYLAELNQALSEQRICALVTVAYEEADPSYSKEHRSAFQDHINEFEQLLAVYKKTIPSGTDEAKHFADLESYYNNVYLAARSALAKALDSGNTAATLLALQDFDAAGDNLATQITTLMEDNTLSAGKKAEENTALAARSTVVEIILLVVVFGLSVVLTYIIASAIGKPMRRILRVAQQAGTTGDLNFPPELIQAVQEDATYKDELAETCGAFAHMMDMIIAQAKLLEQVAGGDLSVEIKKSGKNDTLGNSIEKMVDNLNNMFGKVNIATEQVTSGSTQIADAAQALSQGATEQASAVEELSASMSEVLMQTQANAKNADSAMGSVTKASELMDGTIEYMHQMESAMGGITSSSEEIAKIIKVIDDIAFQTNILALNAAVEAARAGQHGKGFAVVADEVRNLASKSAEAAKETATLIQTSLEHVTRGSEIVVKTSESIGGVAEMSKKTQDLIVEINASSRQQEDAITQINTGIEQVSQVVQTNSATAEESAASSEELSAQAQMLKDLVRQFKLKDTEEEGGYEAAPAQQMPRSASTNRYGVRDYSTF